MLDASVYAAEVGLSPDRAAEASPVRFWQCPAVTLEQALAAKVHRTETVEAYVSEGRWVVMCPDCGGAQLAAREDRRFMCTECANVGAGNLWRLVVWPSDVEAIESVLDERAQGRTRNWIPTETVADLRAQNALHMRPPARSDGKSSDWEGHTHDWPKRADADGTLSCRECGLVVTEALVREGEGG